jgi:hypothetical protein
MGLNNMSTIENVMINKIIDAWESLKGGKSYDPDVIQDWLVCDMKPVIDEARKLVRRKAPKR